MTTSVEERLAAFRARSVQYLALGHDRLAAARFVVDSAAGLRGLALDVGTGKGLLAIELARRGLEVTTVDIDDQERGLAMRLAADAGVADRIAFESHDAARMPYADGRFGCVAMMDVLHHLEDPGPVLREMARVVAPGGLIVVADFDEEGFDFVARVHEIEGREHSRTAVTVRRAADELGEAGLRVVSTASGCQHDVVVMRR